MNLTAKDMGQRLALLRPELISHGLRLTKDMSQAEDLAQDTIERALRFESRFEEGTNLRAWVHHILTNLFISGCRRQRREVKAFTVLSTDPCAWTASGTDRIAMEGFSRSVQRAIDDLPGPFRETLVLSDMQELSYKQVAERLRVPVGTVMSRLHRGRRLLGQALQDGGECLIDRAA